MKYTLSVIKKTISNRERENNELTEKIIEIHKESKKRYSALEIHQQLIKIGYKANLKRIQRLMKNELLIPPTSIQFVMVGITLHQLGILTLKDCRLFFSRTMTTNLIKKALENAY